uniref:Beta-defensin-like domain-containing protein n=1 Tax=Jaculus jaculus TaxID=51337 RepID=A0A8C5K0Q7_JACJA|nr:beta-defensin 4 [Jaculus jaculus]
MRIHYLFFTFLLVLLGPLSAQGISNPFTCFKNRGLCWGKCRGNWQQIGTCGIPGLKCCRKRK